MHTCNPEMANSMNIIEFTLVIGARIPLTKELSNWDGGNVPMQQLPSFS